MRWRGGGKGMEIDRRGSRPGRYWPVHLASEDNERVPKRFAFPPKQQGVMIYTARNTPKAN